MFTKHVLKAKNYVRYVDDIVILSKDWNYLEDCYERYNQYLKDNLELHIHPNKVDIFKVSDGIDFVGRVIHPYYNTTRKRTLDNAYDSMRKLRKCPTDISAYNSLQSYFGILKHTNSYNIKIKLITKVQVENLIGRDGNEKLVKLYK